MTTSGSTFSVENSGGMFAPLFQPAFGMSVFTVFIMVTTQSIPKSFLPAKYVGTKIGGLKAQRWVMLPMATVTMLYAAAAEQAAAGNPVRGHTGGYFVSMAAAGMCMIGRTYSGWFWPLTFIYAMFGQLHHGRKLSQLTDGASWYNSGDWSHMRQYQRLLREKKLNPNV
jgi:hypothetical protein